MGIIRFPQLSKIIRNEILNNILANNRNITRDKIKEQIDIQHNYIWTDSDKFINILESSSVQNKTLFIRNLLISYYNSVKTIFQDTIPKYIMLFLVNKTEDNISSTLYNLLKKKGLGDLLVEYSDIHIKRVELNNEDVCLRNAIDLIESISSV